MSNISSIIIQLIKILKVPVSNKSINEELLMHPNRNTLLAISDLLTSWNVANRSYQIGVEHLKQIPLPFISHTLNDEFL